MTLNFSQSLSLSVIGEPDHIVNALTDYINRYQPTITIDDKADFEIIVKTDSLTVHHKDNGKSILLNIPDRITHVVRQIINTIQQQKTIFIGPYTLNYRQRTLEKDGKDVFYLTEKECDILAYLYSKHGQSVTRDDLLKDVWGYASGVDTHTIETHIYRLRQKIENDPLNPQIVQTQETGYVLGTT